jgi:ABC-2 type transport system permease protein
MNFRVIQAVFRRNFFGFFRGAAGYIFIAVFAVLTAYFQFWHNNRFFAGNLATLDPLTPVMPWILLFFISSITMATWSEERARSTDELLFTLPARDVEIIMGKFLAAWAVYTVALVFTLTNVIMLRYLGRPDVGVIMGTYLGYWLLGAALTATGMFASLLTRSVTGAFILGTLFCAVFATGGMLAGQEASLESGSAVGWLRWAGNRVGRHLGADNHLERFGRGELPLQDVVFFASVIAVMLYLNALALGRRRWPGGGLLSGNLAFTRDARWQWPIRAVSVAAIAVAVNVGIVKAGEKFNNLQADLTEEGLNTLSNKTCEVLAEARATPDRPVTVTAYISLHVPKQYVEVQQDMYNILRQFEARGGEGIDLHIEWMPEIASDKKEIDREKAAKDLYGIEPADLRGDEYEGGTVRNVFLAVAMQRDTEENVIKFMYPGLSVEYELTRSLQTVLKKRRIIVGILDTDAQVNGGVNPQMQQQQPTPEWEIVRELRKQYKIENVQADLEVSKRIQVLIAPMPSSLPQEHLDKLIRYVKSGRPVLILDDPYVFFGNGRHTLGLSASRPKEQDPRMGGGAAKGRIETLMDVLNLRWDTDIIVWDDYNPHARLGLVPQEEKCIFFVGEKAQDAPAFNPHDDVSRGLQEVVLIYPGFVTARDEGASPKVTPLLRTTDRGGVAHFEAKPKAKPPQYGLLLPPIFEKDEVRMGWSMEQDRDSVYINTADGVRHMVAARIGEPPAPPANDSAEGGDEAAAAPAPAGAGGIHAIFIADIDLISNNFFGMRGDDGLRRNRIYFDNITFILNCVDSLAGDTSLFDLRRRRPRQRTLATIENKKESFYDDDNERKKQADKERKDSIRNAEEAFNKTDEDIQNLQNVGYGDKQYLAQRAQADAKEKLKSDLEEIDKKQKTAYAGSSRELRIAVSEIESGVKWAAVCLPPLPAVLLALFVLIFQWIAERRGVDPDRAA